MLVVVVMWGNCGCGFRSHVVVGVQNSCIARGSYSCLILSSSSCVVVQNYL